MTTTTKQNPCPDCAGTGRLASDDELWPGERLPGQGSDRREGPICPRCNGARTIDDEEEDIQ
jgi:DnaJ-class molecular chaperone